MYENSASMHSALVIWPENTINFHTANTQHISMYRQCLDFSTLTADVAIVWLHAVKLYYEYVDVVTRNFNESTGNCLCWWGSTGLCRLKTVLRPIKQLWNQIQRNLTTTTTTYPLNNPLSETTWVSRYQKGKTDLDFTEARECMAVASAGPYASLHLTPER